MESARVLALGTVESGLILRVLSASGDGPWRDLELACDARCSRHEDRYGASGVRAWLSGPAVAAFVRDLESMAASCNGSATVEAHSHGNLSLTIWNLDALGHFAIRFQLGSTASFIRGVAYGVSGGFELSLAELESMLRSLHALTDEGEFGNE